VTPPPTRRWGLVENHGGGLIEKTMEKIRRPTDLNQSKEVGSFTKNRGSASRGGGAIWGKALNITMENGVYEANFGPKTNKRE